VEFATPPTRQVTNWVCGSNSVVESQPSKLLVAGSIPVSRSSVVLGFFGPRVVVQNADQRTPNDELSTKD
jgi:hypothetical protein